MSSASNSASSICGISVGTENCYVAVAKSGGIEILLNEYSQRSTPAYLEFGGNQREIGVSAKQKQMMNVQTTIFAPTRLIGKKFAELDRNEIPYNIEENEKGEVSIRVNHNGEELVLSATQVMAMLFTKLRHIAGNTVDCVLNCPTYFNEPQRRAYINAAQIAGLNPLMLISDLTATALYYGFYRGSSSKQETSIVAFIDCGQTSTQASVVLFNHKENQIRVLNTQCLANVGGKDFDALLAKHFIQQKNLQLNKRATLRLLAECERTKKQMSANSNELPVNIECLYDEKDFSARIDRSVFEGLCEEMFANIQDMLTLTLSRAVDKYNKEFADKGEFKIDSVEVVGGTSRIPAIKRMIKNTFGLEPSTTLNADEAVACGCALQCAILSPTFKVAKELHVVDLMPYQIDFKYGINPNDLKSVTALYPRGHQFPFTKQVSLNSLQLPFYTLFYGVNDKGQQQAISEYVISEHPGSNASQYLGKSPVKLRIRVNPSGLLSINSATISYEKEDTEETSDKMETDQAAAAAPANNDNAEQTETKRKTKAKMASIDLLVEARYVAGEMNKDELSKAMEFESNMILADKNWKEKTDSRNALEEFIYEWRDRLDTGAYDAFIDSPTKLNFSAKIEENSSWLYEQDDQGVMHSKSVYEERINAMNDPYAKAILFRKREFESRPRALEQFGQRLQLANKIRLEPVLQDDQEDYNKFSTTIDEKQKWFDDVSGKLATMNTTQDPAFTCDDIHTQVGQLDACINSYTNARKRRAESREQAAKKAAEEAAKKKQGEAEAAPAAAAAGDGDPSKAGDNPAAATNGQGMEVDDQENVAQATA